MTRAFGAAHERWARRVVEHEREAHGATAAEAGARAYDKIFERLAPIVGRAGVRAVYARSVELAKRDAPALGELAMDGDATGGAGSLVRALEGASDETAEGAVVTWLATYFALFTTFLGDGLITQILRAAWPELAFDLKETK